MTSLQVWAIVGGLIVILAGSVTGLSKWSRNRIDTRVLDYLEEHARKHSDGSRSRSLADIAQALAMSEKRVLEALSRLRRRAKSGSTARTGFSFKSNPMAGGVDFRI